MPRVPASYVLTLALVSAALAGPLAPRARAQDAPAVHDHEHMHGAPEASQPAWHWEPDGNVFFGYNLQQRKFADFTAWESQNWFGLTGQRTSGRSRLDLHAMITLEPFTIQALGSPQLFQTGESYQQTPLVNNQHPHDLVMALGATYRMTRGPVTYVAGADLVGSPALGPTPFMHRESSRDNPQVPLIHHALDSTHITPGVVRAGVEAGAFTLEASAFRGAEPDENRRNLERPRLDSWSGRLGWHRGAWQAQVSGGHLRQPEWYEPYDLTRLTASVGFDGTVASRPLSATLAWGRNHHAVVANGTSDNFLFEWDFRATTRLSTYGRAEVAEKEIFGLGLHPAGFAHPHFYSHVDAVTLGLVDDVLTLFRSRWGLGADVTLYHMSPDLLPYWQGSHSYHVFLRWRPSVAAAHHH